MLDMFLSMFVHLAQQSTVDNLTSSNKLPSDYYFSSLV